MMNKKFKLALAALLGFSAACSPVRNTPAKGADDAAGAKADTTQQFRHIIAMYGVRRPISPELPADSLKSMPIAPISEESKEAPAERPSGK